MACWLVQSRDKGKSDGSQRVQFRRYIEVVQNAEVIYEKIENPFREKLFILVIIVFFPLSNLIQISTVNFWTHLDGKFITFLLNKFNKWRLIFVNFKILVDSNFRHLQKDSSLRGDFFWPIFGLFLNFLV